MISTASCVLRLLDVTRAPPAMTRRRKRELFLAKKIDAFSSPPRSPSASLASLAVGRPVAVRTDTEIGPTNQGSRSPARSGPLPHTTHTSMAGCVGGWCSA